MLGKTFYHNILRKTTIGFGTIFNDISIVRRSDSSDTESQEQDRIKVGLVYGSKQKWYQRLVSQTRTDELVSKTKIILPVIAFEMTGLSYDSTRKTSGITTRAGYRTDQTVLYRFNKIPYSVDYSVHVLVKNLDDGLQIIEQVLAFFQPEYTLDINFTDLDEKFDMNVTLEGITMDDTAGGTFDSEKVLMFTLTFKCRINIIGPITESGIILEVDTNFWNFGQDGELFETMVITPPAGATPGSDLSGLTGFGVDITIYETGLTGVTAGN